MPDNVAASLLPEFEVAFFLSRLKRDQYQSLILELTVGERMK
jgi:hypothetical protein